MIVQRYAEMKEKAVTGKNLFFVNEIYWFIVREKKRIFCETWKRELIEHSKAEENRFCFVKPTGRGESAHTPSCVIAQAANSMVFNIWQISKKLKSGFSQMDFVKEVTPNVNSINML